MAAPTDEPALTDCEVFRVTTGTLGVLVGITTVEFDRLMNLMMLLLLARTEEVLLTETGTLVVELFFSVMICVVGRTGKEVGTWIWPSVICVMGFKGVATDVESCEMIFPEEEAAADAEPAVDDFGTPGFALEIPNWVEYWNWPVPVTMICKP